MICEIRNEYLSATVLQTPADSWLELWVADNLEERVLKIIRIALDSKRVVGKPWDCPSCSEKIESQFTECWSCGSGRSG